MTFQFHLLCFYSLFLILQAEWVEITQKPTGLTTTSKPKPVIRVLQKPKTDIVPRSDANTPSPEWLEYQRERFGNRQNSQKLVVTSGQQLKNSAKIIVPANRKDTPTTKRNKIIQTKSRLDIINGKPMESLVELPHLEPQTTTKRDMNEGSDQEYEYVEVEDEEPETVEQNAEETVTQKPPKEETNQNVIQGPSWQGFLKFLKTIQNNWIKNSGLSIDSKLQSLKNLKDNLMRKIEEQFFMLWKPKEYVRRNKRGLLDESKINFPPETALISMSFLTFAVFLIKLVLQIVNIIRSKHYNFTKLEASQLFRKTNLKT